VNPSDEKKPDPAILRSMAEAKLASHPPTELPPVDELPHELKVHQVELAMQNEILRETQPCTRGVSASRCFLRSLGYR